MDDKLIVNMLFDRSESALEHISQKYQRTLFGISYNIVGSREDAEECVNDTYLGVWNAIPPTRPHSLYAFVCRIVRNISLTRYYHDKAKKRNRSVEISLEEIGDFLSDGDFCDRELEKEELRHMLEEWLYSLNEENRYIFIRRYWYMDDPERISGELGLTKAAVYLRIDRMKKNLKEYLTQKGVLI